MPAIETGLLLDLLLGVIVLLFVPLGLWRGVAKEAMVSAGILLGAAIATAWAERWGDDLAAEVDLGRQTARFVVATAALVGSTILLGYGGGVALGRVRQGIMARLAGGLLGALNGALLLAYLLTFVQDYLREGEGPGVLDDGIVAGALLEDFDWLLVGAAGALLLAVLLGLLVTTIRHRREPVAPVAAEADAGHLAPRQRPIRLARAGDTGKYEPVAGASPGRFGSGTHPAGETRPLAARPETRLAGGEPGGTGTWPEPPPNGNARRFGNGHTPTPPAGDEWLRRAAAMTRPGEPTGPPRGGEPTTTPAADIPTPRWPFGADAGGTAGAGGSRHRDATERRCPACGATAGGHDLFCPECGTTL